ncbi:ABC transporter ATP-binding protein [Pasteurellaceae bacterium 20609_3]|uniref:ABC transporter ATP-binding protein n=1 Tax=Spirabiliibacterium mucosae TaxID=28156 RepID=UPI001AAD7201|nr:ABC transporter ATP-binding protein [Spirabiliibacterium mucosae]MBE2898772.1 ABC transporter ATP-binding protein [Spirabiliibacterium mucosae]
MNKTALCLHKLGFHYPRAPWLFEDLSFALAQGEILAILGPNGCGKSTLLSLLLGHLKPRTGTLQVASTIGFVPQFFTAAFDYTVLDIVLMGRAQHIRTFATPRAQDRQAALAALAQMQLSALAPQSFNTLSGGQKQLVLIAQALASECQIMMLDEPTSALDLFNQNQVLNLLAELARERRISIVFTTHQPNHALAIADKTLLMHPGQPHFGASNAVLSAEQLSRLFTLAMSRHRVTEHGVRFEHIIPLFDTLVTPHEHTDYP